MQLPEFMTIKSVEYFEDGRMVVHISCLKRAIYKTAGSVLGNNNWRKQHGLPMWRK